MNNSFPKNLFIMLYRVLLITVFFIELVNGQTSKSLKKDDFDIQRLVRRVLDLSTVENSIQLKNITGISIIDARPDSTAIGLIQKSYRKPGFYILKGGVTNNIALFLKQYLHTSQSAKAKVIMVLRKCWLSDEFSLMDGNYELTKKDIEKEQKNLLFRITIKAEFYLQQEQDYYPLYRYDSVATIIPPPNGEVIGFLKDCLKDALYKLPAIDNNLSEYSNRKRLSWQQIDEFNHQGYELPILKDSTKKRGVYMSFEEFKNNAPSEPSFELKKDKLIDVIFIKKMDGTEFAPRNVWGYCDGENAYIKSIDNFFLLQLQLHSFYIYGAKRFKNDTAPTGGLMLYRWYNPVYPATSSVYSYGDVDKGRKLVLNPYVVDWDTGKLY